MARCPECDGEFAAGDLERHERPTSVVVHCPDCGRRLGRYADPADRHPDMPDPEDN